MQAQDVMTRDVATVRPETPLADAIAIMLDRRVSGLPVIGADGRLAGVLTEGDLLRRIETGTEPNHARWYNFLLGPGRQAAAYVRTHSRQVADLMTEDVVTVSPETPLADIVGLMESKRIKRLPVLQDDALVGLVSRADLLRALSKALAEDAPAAPKNDLEIRDAILAEMTRQKWAPLNGIGIQVDDGVVVVSGNIFDNRDRAALLVMARNAPGVKSVRDDLTWVEPVTGETLGPTV